MQAFPRIALSVAGHIGELCLNSPETHNCFDHDLEARKDVYRISRDLEAMRIAAKIASLPPAAVQGTKRAFVKLMQEAGNEIRNERRPTPARR
jgi:enoyl-CoA hydratase/carnithine racemase